MDGAPKDPKQYSLLPWSGKRWEATSQCHGGQPCIEVNGTQLVLGTRGPWAGFPGFKIPALTFVAKEKGTYSLRGTAEIQIWEGPNEPLALRILQSAPNGRMFVVGECGLAQAEEVPLAGLSVDLPAGGRLTITVSASGHHQGASLYLNGLAVQSH